MSDRTLDYYNNYIAQFESTDRSYTAYNKKSGAYGMYQHLPSTTTKASKRLGKSVSYLRTPDGQEEAQKWLLTENIGELKRRGIPVTPANVYGIHQQGGYVLSKMVKGIPLTERETELVRSNTPASHRTSGDVVKDWYGKYDVEGESSYQPTIGDVPQAPDSIDPNVQVMGLQETELPKAEALSFGTDMEYVAPKPIQQEINLDTATPEEITKVAMIDTGIEAPQFEDYSTYIKGLEDETK